MYQVGDWVNFEYDRAKLHGIIVPFEGQRVDDYSRESYLIHLKGFVDNWLPAFELQHWGWASYYGEQGARYLWIDHTERTLEYYRGNHLHLQCRPVSPVFYSLQEVK